MTATKPILFSGPMVRAILDGRKTQTRRAVKPQPDMALYPIEVAELISGHSLGRIRSPFLVGDLLWVREQHILSGDRQSAACFAVSCSCGMPEEMHVKTGWRPSIHMPRWACRLWLRVTDVRVQRVQEISAKDIIAEGAVVRSHDVEAFAMIGANPKCPVSAFDNCVYPDLRSLWAAGWDSINGKRPGCSWADNPWVWAITFERTEAPQ